MANLSNLKPFKSGDDPRRNTKGRPKGCVNFREIIKGKVGKKITVNGKKIKIEEALVLKLISEALKGKFWAHKLYMNYMYGKPVSYCPICSKRNILEEKSKKITDIQKTTRKILELRNKNNKNNQNLKNDFKSS